MTQTTVVLREPSDLIASLPFILGFHPSRCVVAVHLHGSRAGLIQRFDVVVPPTTWTSQESLLVLAALERERPTGVILLAYEDTFEETAHVMGLIEDVMADAHVPLVDVLRVHNGRFRSLLCDEDCCEAIGFAVPEAAQTPVVAEWVGLGIDPLPSREALADLFSAADADQIPARSEMYGDRGAAGRRTRRMNTRQAMAAAASWAAVIDPAERHGGVSELPRRVVASAVNSLWDIGCRDALIAWLAPGIFPVTSLDERHRRALQSVLGSAPWRSVSPPRSDGYAGYSVAEYQDMEDSATKDGATKDSDTQDDGADEGIGHEGIGHDPGAVAARRRCTDRLLQAVRRVPMPDQVPLLCVIAAFAWWQGDGVRARLSVERARDLDPSYNLAGLLHSLVTYGVRLRSHETPMETPGTLEDLRGLGA